MKKLLAILSCAALVLSFAACGSTENETTTAAETTESAVETVSETETEETAESVTDETEATEETASEAETETETTAAETTAAETTKKAETTTKKATATTKKAETTKKEETTEAAKVPSTKAEILAVYNDATKKASSSKPGYTKKVTTSIPSIEMGALAKISVVRETVGSFLGEGTTTTTVSKGKFNGTDLKVSSLKESDVSSATCKLSSDGKYYDITITVKNESDLSKSSSALGRFTNDYKDISEIKQGLADAGASLDSMTLKSTKAVIKAKIGVSNSQFSSLSYTINMDGVLNNVKYSIAKVSQATCTISTQVDYSSFKY